MKEYKGKGKFLSTGWVIEKNPTESAENITLCNGIKS